MYLKSLVCNKTGKTGEIWLERYTEMSGEYKPVTYSGNHEVLAALGKKCIDQICVVKYSYI